MEFGCWFYCDVLLDVKCCDLWVKDFLDPSLVLGVEYRPLFVVEIWIWEMTSNFTFLKNFFEVPDRASFSSPNSISLLSKFSILLPLYIPLYSSCPNPAPNLITPSSIPPPTLQFSNPATPTPFLHPQIPPPLKLVHPKSLFN